MTATPTAQQLGYAGCHVCSLVCKWHPGEMLRCPRCTAPLHDRKTNSIVRTWAFLLAAAILYIPANLLPIMHTASLFEAQQDTIISGVLFLWHSGSWLLAGIVFTASIVVPLFKLAALSMLLVFVQRRSSWRPRQRATLYRVIDFIGRWSMLDIFVVAMLVGLVQLQTLAFIAAGPAAVAFGAVVVLTMLASISFDPRLIWDFAASETSGVADERAVAKQHESDGRPAR